MFRANKRLLEQVETLEKVNSTLKTQVDNLQEIEKKTNTLMTDNLRLSRELESLKAELISAKNTIRKQTEADLLLNALKAVGIIQEQKDEKPDYFAQDLALQARLGKQQRPNTLNALGGMFGGLI